MKQLQRPSLRQLPLWQWDTTIPLSKEARIELIDALADLLLEVLVAAEGQPTTEASNESQD